jgi:hypothetical protein
MMHTEEEAKDKFCPLTAFIFATGEVEIITNRKPDCCIASECMMWRWCDVAFMYLFSPPEQEGWIHDPYFSESGKKVDRWRRDNVNRKGYCGLGGKP